MERRQIEFFKYQGTGNDFIMVDNREAFFPKEETAWIARLCHRRFGIGADGLILLEDHDEADFRMVYFNSDGKIGSMCGNGGRCIVAFAAFLQVIDSVATFYAADGLHTATIVDDMVTLAMGDVSRIKERPSAVFLDTGSPHHVQLVTDLDGFDVTGHGARLRYGLYGQEGSNINFVQVGDDGSFHVRTYERGVEDETLSCGTGVTAVALAMHHLGKTPSPEVLVQTRGGNLNVGFRPNGNGYTGITLTGPAEFVFKGTIECNV